jgi:hypothetical protein
MSSNTLGIQSDLHKFDAIRKEKKGKGFSLTSARVPTCLADGACFKNTCEIKMPVFQDVKETDNDYCSVL